MGGAFLLPRRFIVSVVVAVEVRYVTFYKQERFQCFRT